MVSGQIRDETRAYLTASTVRLLSLKTRRRCSGVRNKLSSTRWLAYYPDARTARSTHAACFLPFKDYILLFSYRFLQAASALARMLVLCVGMGSARVQPELDRRLLA